MSNFFAMLCPRCGRPSEYPSEAFGTWTRCPHCRAEVVAKPSVEPPNPAIPFDHPPEKPANVPDLRTCRQCSLTILKSAEFCPHCGVRQKERKGTAAIIATVAGMALLAGVVLLLAQRRGGMTAPPGRVLHATIQFNTERVSIRNDDPFAWKDAEVYLNGAPPYTYHFSLGSLPAGNSTVIALASFDFSGASFLSSGARITNIWVGEPGYDFNNYAFE
jgi:hypothetical protein